jgi:hypothetical protein
MGATLQLVHGDMFDGPTDLIVLPCATVGSVTEMVRQRLRAFEIPNPPRRMRLGDIEIRPPTQSLRQLASFLAFAASVQGYTSNLEAIGRIGRQLGKFAADNRSVLQISAPLLGAGAGGLRPADVLEHLKNAFMETAPDRTSLKVFVLQLDLYEQLHGDFSRQSTEKTSSIEKIPDDRFIPIRAFFSYTRTTEEHSSWVKDLATFLRGQGIDSRLDQWHLTPGQDVAQWMCNEVELADRVLMICNEEYAMRADGRHGGVGWEIRLIQGYLLQEGAKNPNKFVPIVCTPDCKDGLPSFLRTTYFLHWPYVRRSDPKLHEEIVKILYKVGNEAPPIGRPPSFIVEALGGRQRT